jgi:CHAD domain-containing protein
VIPGHDLARAQQALKKRLKAFARLRDTHTQLLLVGQRRGHLPATAEYLQALHRREGRLIQRVRRKLARIRQGRLAGSVAAIQKQFRSRAAAPGLEEKRSAAVQEALRAAYANVVARHRAIVPADTSTIHRTRVAFKQFRYMIEALQPLLPGVDEHQLKSMDRYQTRMGEIQDLVVLLGNVDKFVKRHHRKGEGWRSFRADLVRRRAALIKRFMASRGELFEFHTFSPSHLEPPNTSQRKRHHGTLHLAPRHRRPARRPRLRG